MHAVLSNVHLFDGALHVCIHIWVLCATEYLDNSMISNIHEKKLPPRVSIKAY